MNEVIIDRKVLIPMKDGTRLAADIYRPNADGSFPAIVERTPYNREESVILRTGTPRYFAERGFVFIVQDVRGRFGSEGTWYPFVDDGWGERQDGYETIEWIARQPWCNGKVATVGGSYAGQTQMFVAPTRPPALACCFIREAASNLAEQWCYRGGAYEWGFNHDWNVRHGAYAMRRQLELIDSLLKNADRFTHLPLGRQDEMASPFDWIHDNLRRRDDKDYWEQFDFERHYGDIEVPIYHMAGWFDIFLDGSLRNFAGIQEEGKSKRARHNQKLVIGPWTHGPTVADPAFARHVGEMDFGEQALLDFNGEMHRWYDQWLNDHATGVLDEPRVRYFLMGANRWETSDTWPPTGTRAQKWYLHTGPSGSATSLNDGSLSVKKPARENPDSYDYDPANPVPTVGGNTLYAAIKKSGSGEENPDFTVTAGPRDQRSIEPRCLTYTSELLEKDLDVIGKVWCTLFASSSCVDTDFVARLCDVFPDGRSMLVCDGILRARYRKYRFKPRLLTPEKVYRFDVDLWPTAWRFQAGHRLRLIVTSSCFPRFDRNPNTGDPDSSTLKAARNSVFHDKDYASHLLLPVRE